MTSNSLSSCNQGTPDYPTALNRLAQRKPAQVLLYANGLLLIEVKKQASLFQALKLWPHERLFAPEYIAFDNATFCHTVFYEMSWACHNDGPVEHQRLLLNRKIHPDLESWLSARLSDTSPDYAAQVNIHDLLEVDKATQNLWMPEAISNSLTLINRHEATADTDKVAAALTARFFSTLDNTQQHQALELFTRHIGRSLFCVPENWRSFAACNAAVASSLLNLKQVPHAHLVNGLYEQYCLGKADALPFINMAHMDETLARITIRCHPKALLYLPIRFHTSEIYDYALMQHSESIAFVLEQRLNEALCAKAADYHADALAHIPPRLLTQHVLSCACANNRSFFYFIPPVYRSLEVCRMAVELEPMSRQWVPVAFINSVT